MTKSSDRHCIFCGKAPEAKNLEHPLPRWLLALTGDPNRVVRHGLNWKTGEVIEFAFDSLRFPSCRACNSDYAPLEEATKPIIKALIRKEAVSPRDYVVLLDWLDKVRIGLWLGYRYLMGALTPPSFTINTRVGMKDRMVAVYTIGDHQQGLNVWGAETPLFHIKPSVFALRIENTLLLNCSWDWMCSSRCGYPYPRDVRHSVERTGFLVATSYKARKRITHPIMPGLMKSCATVFQPIIHEGSQRVMHSGDFQYHLLNSWPDRANIGPLFRQFDGETIQIDEDGEPLVFDSVSLKEARRTINIATQAYSLQNESVTRDPILDEDGCVVRPNSGFMRTAAQFNRKKLTMLRGTTPEQYAAMREQIDADRAEKQLRKRSKHNAL
jgi:hypothetical protein